jgi:hypothetical protein
MDNALNLDLLALTDAIGTPAGPINTEWNRMLTQGWTNRFVPPVLTSSVPATATAAAGAVTATITGQWKVGTLMRTEVGGNPGDSFTTVNTTTQTGVVVATPGTAGPYTMLVREVLTNRASNTIPFTIT